jgi:hypothetical protein
MAGRRDWVDVDMDGLRKILERRGKELAVYELVQNAWDENVTKVEVTITRPENGRSELVVTDDSPEGFRDLTDSYTMFAESYKKADPDKRGAFNLGEKYVLALCDEALHSLLWQRSTLVAVVAPGSNRLRYCPSQTPVVIPTRNT